MPLHIVPSLSILIMSYFLSLTLCFATHVGVGKRANKHNMNASENVPWLLLDVKFTSISNHPGSNWVIIILCRQKGKHQWTMFWSAELILEFWLGQQCYNVMTQVLNFRILPYDSIKMYVYFTTIWWPGDPVPWCTGRITWMGRGGVTPATPAHPLAPDSPQTGWKM